MKIEIDKEDLHTLKHVLKNSIKGLDQLESIENLGDKDRESIANIRPKVEKVYNKIKSLY